MAALDAVQQYFEDTPANTESDRLAEFDAVFHQTLVDASKNELLIAISKMVTQAFSEFR
ncbi:MAG: FCD domain-containing protein [Planctomycetota bacterium]|nr:FCD domain-containing protein [Planctomycetota bacterium]